MRQMKHLLILFVIVAALTGCTTPPPAPPPPPPREPHIAPHYGHVSRINQIDGYVILECTYLPTTGEVITLYRDRNKRVSSRVRVNSNSSSHWVAADIVEGNPMIGDWFLGATEGPNNQQRP
jgi:hypothetical protein